MTPNRIAAGPAARLGGVVLGLCLFAGGAAAGTAVVQGPVNIRSGPGSGYAVVGTLPRGATLDVVDCTPTWCRLNGVSSAYVHGRYLAFPGTGVVALQPPSPVIYETAASPVVVRRMPVIVLPPPAVALPAGAGSAAQPVQRVFYPPLLTYSPVTYWRW